METKYEIKVTKINKRYHVRLLCQEIVIDECACELKNDIGFVSKWMLRMEDKMGGDEFTTAARKRFSENSVGKIWYSADLRKF